ncbi:AraC family transcriptional regulator [Thiocapsa marina]|uniref:Transcriptional regulator, AraC family n=1 Tax=Thiocapsa marina 5811 TaxID=768671 RepID=F9UB72_9GAMM|nr:AraC family transcriptional regulator [Thiocapsa marina]EGV18690.1 transcriptional regulator, AraC family [Thiocapsa marina 5811]
MQVDYAPLSYMSSDLPLVMEGSLRIAPFLQVPNLLVEFGLDPASITAEAGLDIGLFDDPEQGIPLAAAGRLLALAAERSGCPSFGHRLGEQVGLDALGRIGQLAKSAPDVSTALHQVVLYLHLHDRGAVPALWISADRVVMAYVVYQAEVPGIEHIYDGAVAITFNIVKLLCGAGFEPIEVRLSRPRPADVEPYRRFYRSRISFGAEHSAVVFSADWLKRPLDGADGVLHKQLLQIIEFADVRGEENLVANLRRVIRCILVQGVAPEDTSLAHIARLFSLHRRTLNRRLQSLGTTFKTLIDEARYDVARQLLRDTSLPVVDIAASLDYADAAAFSRAFKRWSGVSPGAWRRSLPPP